jgi:hypothetical protein
LKKNAAPCLRHCLRIDLTHEALISRALGPDSPPTMTPVDILEWQTFERTDERFAREEANRGWYCVEINGTMHDADVFHAYSRPHVFRPRQLGRHVAQAPTSLGQDLERVLGT